MKMWEKWVYWGPHKNVGEGNNFILFLLGGKCVNKNKYLKINLV